MNEAAQFLYNTVILIELFVATVIAMDTENPKGLLAHWPLIRLTEGREVTTNGLHATEMLNVVFDNGSFGALSMPRSSTVERRLIFRKPQLRINANFAITGKILIPRTGSPGAITVLQWFNLASSVSMRYARLIIYYNTMIFYNFNDNYTQSTTTCGSVPRGSWIDIGVSFTAPSKITFYVAGSVCDVFLVDGVRPSTNFDAVGIEQPVAITAPSGQIKCLQLWNTSLDRDGFSAAFKLCEKWANIENLTKHVQRLEAHAKEAEYNATRSIKIMSDTIAKAHDDTKIRIKSVEEKAMVQVRTISAALSKVQADAKALAGEKDALLLETVQTHKNRIELMNKSRSANIGDINEKRDSEASKNKDLRKEFIESTARRDSSREDVTRLEGRNKLITLVGSAAGAGTIVILIVLLLAVYACLKRNISCTTEARYDSTSTQVSKPRRTKKSTKEPSTSDNAADTAPPALPEYDAWI